MWFLLHAKRLSIIHLQPPAVKSNGFWLLGWTLKLNPTIITKTGLNPTFICYKSDSCNIPIYIFYIKPIPSKYLWLTLCARKMSCPIFYLRIIVDEWVDDEVCYVIWYSVWYIFCFTEVNLNNIVLKFILRAKKQLD